MSDPSKNSSGKQIKEEMENRNENSSETPPSLASTHSSQNSSISLSQISLPENGGLILSQRTMETYMTTLVNDLTGNSSSPNSSSENIEKQQCSTSAAGPSNSVANGNGLASNIPTTPPALSQEYATLQPMSFQPAPYFGAIPQGNILVNHFPVAMASPAVFQPMVSPGLAVTPRPVEIGSPDLLRASLATISPRIPTPMNKTDIPISSPHPGQYGFEISFPQPKEMESKKAISYTYSDEMKKWYVKLKTWCPVQFKCAGVQPPTGTNIRAMVVYSRAQDMAEVVRPCNNHALSDGMDFASRFHVLRVQHNDSQYYDDSVTGRHSVIVPWEKPIDGVDYQTVLYQFLCFTSCTGSINRRPMQIIFTLEYNNVVVGRQSVDVRACACPGRDRRVDEDQEKTPKKRGARSTFSVVAKTFKKSRPAPSKGKWGPNSGKRQPAPTLRQLGRSPSNTSDSDDDDAVFNLEIRGRKMFNMMRAIHRNFELAAQFRRMRSQRQQGTPISQNGNFGKDKGNGDDEDAFELDG